MRSLIQELLTMVMDCPECAYVGNIYFEYKKTDIQQYWLIDKSRSQVLENPQEIINKPDSTTQLFQN